MGEFHSEARGADHSFTGDFQPETTLIPWIDIHGHHHSITWNELETYGLTGCSAIIMSPGNIGAETPYRPISTADIQTQWDRIIRFSHNIARSFPFDAYASIAIHTTNGPIANHEDLIEKIPAYANLDEVVALSETGITMVQEHATLPLDRQRSQLHDQLRQANAADIPAILHTPTLGKADPDYVAKSTETHTTGDTVLTADNPKLEGVKISLDCIHDAGMPEDQVVFTHGHRSIVSWVLEETDCYLSFTIGNPRRDVTFADVQAAVKTYGPDRIMVDTDAAAIYEFDPKAVKRLIVSLLRAGIAPAAIRQIVYENQRQILDLHH